MEIPLPQCLRQIHGRVAKLFLEEGETQNAETMIKCIVIASGNDASVAMLSMLLGTEQAFVDRMNERRMILE